MVSSVGEKCNVNIYETCKVVKCDANFYNIHEHKYFTFSIESSKGPLHYLCTRSIICANSSLSFKGKIYFSDYY